MLLFAAPTLDLLFSLRSGFLIEVHLKKDELVDAILGRELIAPPLMLPQTFTKVPSHSCVGQALLFGEDVDPLAHDLR